MKADIFSAYKTTLKIFNTNRIIILVFVLTLCDLIKTHQNYVEDNSHNLSTTVTKIEPNENRVRRKRFLWMKNRKLILPPGSILTITPVLQIPFLRQPPEGLNSDIKLSWIFYMFFDKLGMTDESHPFPPFYPFSDFFRVTRRDPDKPKKRRMDRSVLSLPTSIHGGERAMIIPQLEKILASIGIDDSRSCLLRTVCEIHEFPLHEEGYGLFGEILTLIFSVSLSPYAESHLAEYLKAENAGKSGDCVPYFKNCKKSLFVWEEKNKYSKEMQNIHHSTDRVDEHDSDNEIFDKSIK